MMNYSVMSSSNYSYKLKKYNIKDMSDKNVRNRKPVSNTKATSGEDL